MESNNRTEVVGLSEKGIAVAKDALSQVMKAIVTGQRPEDCRWRMGTNVEKVILGDVARVAKARAALAEESGRPIPEPVPASLNGKKFANITVVVDESVDPDSITLETLTVEEAEVGRAA